MPVRYTPRILTVVSFSVIIAFSWANELFDLPNLLLSAPMTPVNWKESLTETFFLAVTGILFYRFAVLYEKNLEKHLRGLHTICSCCHSVKDDDSWTSLEAWIAKKSEAVLSHGLCPDCLQKRHPAVYEKMIREGLIRPESP